MKCMKETTEMFLVGLGIGLLVALVLGTGIRIEANKEYNELRQLVMEKYKLRVPPGPADETNGGRPILPPEKTFP